MTFYTDWYHSLFGNPVLKGEKRVDVGKPSKYVQMEFNFTEEIDYCDYSSPQQTETPCDPFDAYSYSNYENKSTTGGKTRAGG
jgi:hypothetical protein